MKHFVLILSFVTLFFSNVLYPQIATPKTDLYYFVVDASGSIASYKLTEPIKSAVQQFITKLPDNSEVRIVLFNDVATSPKSWIINTQSQNDIINFFGKAYKPSGNTRLYDTVFETINDIRASCEAYRYIKVYILSDGEDTCSKIKTWEPLDPYIQKLRQLNPKSYITWYTLGFEPKTLPSKDSEVEVVRKKDPAKGFRIENPPKPSFLVFPQKVIVKKDVLFGDNSSGEYTIRKWDFGDGNTSAETSPKHSYTKEGNYKATLTLTGPDGTVSTSETVYVTSIPPFEANFRWTPKNIRVNQKVDFIDNSIGSPEKWTWIIEDKGIMNEKAPSVVFSKSGDKTVILNIQKETEQSSCTNIVTVLDALPIATFTLSTNELLIGQTLSIKADKTNTDWKHIWSIGGDIILTGPAPKWKANKIGLIKIIQSVENAGGIARSTPKVVIVNNPIELIPKFNAAPKSGRIPFEVQFSDKTEGEINSWHWDFGDGNTSNHKNPIHKYKKSGQYEVTLLVKNVRGKKAESGEPIKIIVKPPFSWTVKNLWWIIPAIILFLILIIFIIKILRTVAEKHQMYKLDGCEIKWQYDDNDNYDSGRYEIPDGSNTKELFVPGNEINMNQLEIDSQWTLKVSAIIDNYPIYILEPPENSNNVQIQFEPNQSVDFYDYKIKIISPWE